MPGIQCVILAPFSVELVNYGIQYLEAKIFLALYQRLKSLLMWLGSMELFITSPHHIVILRCVNSSLEAVCFWGRQSISARHICGERTRTIQFKIAIPPSPLSLDTTNIINARTKFESTDMFKTNKV